MPGAGYLCGFFVTFGCPDVAFGKAVIVHQRNLARADVAAGTAFDAVEQVVFLGPSGLAAFGKPVQVHRLQVGRAGFGTFTAADAGQGGRPGREQLAGLADQAVGGLGDAGTGIRQYEAHHRATHDDAVVSGQQAGRLHQPVGRCADQGFDIAGAGDGAGQGDETRHDGDAALQCLPHRIGGSDVEALHAEFGRAATVRDFLAGEHADELLGASAGIARRHGYHFDAGAGNGGHHGGNGFGFVVLDADQHFARLHAFGQEPDALDDIGCTFAHQAVVAGDVGLAFGAVDDQGFQAFCCDFQASGENCPPEADHTLVGQRVLQGGSRHLLPCNRGRIDAAVQPVRFDHDAQVRQSGRMGKRARLDGQHAAGCGRVDSDGNPAVGISNALVGQHAGTDMHARLGRVADALVQRDDQQRRDAGMPQWHMAGFGLVFGRMDAAMKGIQRSHAVGASGFMTLSA